MAPIISRRSFIKMSTAIGASTVVSGSLFFDLVGSASHDALLKDMVDISVATGNNYYDNTIKSVEQMGGMKRFVSKGSIVGINHNAVRTLPGTNVKPEILIAVIMMCYSAGAKEIWCMKDFPFGYCRGHIAEKFSNEIYSLKFSERDCVTVDIPKGKTLKRADVVKELLECDVYINIPITKHHDGTKFTGALKNAMGASPHNPTNRFCHKSSSYDAKSWYENVEFLSQCIADLNLVRKPDLCISDSTEFITTNGPYGPGIIKKPQKVIASIDPVAIDTYCTSLLGLNGSNILMIKRAYEHGIGEIDMNKLNIIKVKV